MSRVRVVDFRAFHPFQLLRQPRRRWKHFFFFFYKGLRACVTATGKPVNVTAGSEIGVLGQGTLAAPLSLLQSRARFVVTWQNSDLWLWQSAAHHESDERLSIVRSDCGLLFSGQDASYFMNRGRQRAVTPTTLSANDAGVGWTLFGCEISSDTCLLYVVDAIFSSSLWWWMCTSPTRKRSLNQPCGFLRTVRGYYGLFVGTLLSG